METGIITQILERGMRDSQWLGANRAALEKKYDEKFIAILDCQVIAADKQLDKVLEQVKSKGLVPGEILVEFVSKFVRIL